MPNAKYAMLCFPLTIGKRPVSSSGLFTPSARKVSAIGKTPSAATATDVRRACREMKVCQHWLAASLNKAFNDYDETKSKYTINSVEIPYNSVKIKAFVHNYNSVVGRRINDIHEHELSLTALLAELFKEVAT